MELSTQEAEIPMPLNSVYGGVHTHAHQGSNLTHHNYQHHNHQNQPLSSTPPLDNHHTNAMHTPITTTMPSNTNNNNGKTKTPTLKDHENDQEVPYNNKDTKNSNNNNPTITSIRYRECQKNHAASIGGKALDGCGEFMPSGDEGTFEALICSACNCHRNFHRKEINGHHHHNHNHNQSPFPDHFFLPHPRPIVSTRGRNMNSGGGGGSSSGGLFGYPTSLGRGSLVPISRALPLNVSYNVGLHEHEDGHGHGGGGGGMVVMSHGHEMVKRRFRTKFSQEQKEKMLEFAHKVGWKIQKQEDSVVQQFCQEIGIKRRVLKVWMHNNKHNFAKKCIDNNDLNTTSNLLN